MSLRLDIIGGGGRYQSKQPKTNRTWSQQVPVKQLKHLNRINNTNLNNKSDLFFVIWEFSVWMRTNVCLLNFVCLFFTKFGLVFDLDKES